MSNEVTKTVTKPLYSPSGTALGDLVQVTCSIDTSDTELVIGDAVAKRGWNMLGIQLGLTETHGVTIYAANTPIVTWKVNTEGQILQPPSNGLFAMTDVNESIGISLNEIQDTSTVTFFLSTSNILSAYQLGVPK